MYNTKQKNEIILFFEKHSSECFSCRDLIENSELSIGEATIYRLLPKLADEGVLSRFTDSGGSYYRFNACACADEHKGEQEHFHLRCTGCGELFHADSELAQGMRNELRERFGFNVDNTATVIYGTCEKCESKKPKN